MRLGLKVEHVTMIDPNTQKVVGYVYPEDPNPGSLNVGPVEITLKEPKAFGFFVENGEYEFVPEKSRALQGGGAKKKK